jgi:hypothetical protein
MAVTEKLGDPMIAAKLAQSTTLIRQNGLGRKFPGFEVPQFLHDHCVCKRALPRSHDKSEWNGFVVDHRLWDAIREWLCRAEGTIELNIVRFFVSRNRPFRDPDQTTNILTVINVFLLRRHYVPVFIARERGRDHLDIPLAREVFVDKIIQISDVSHKLLPASMRRFRKRAGIKPVSFNFITRVLPLQDEPGRSSKIVVFHRSVRPNLFHRFSEVYGEEAIATGGQLQWRLPELRACMTSTDAIAYYLKAIIVLMQIEDKHRPMTRIAVDETTGDISWRCRIRKFLKRTVRHLAELDYKGESRHEGNV